MYVRRLYRFGLGSILRDRFLLLIHRGRKSSKPHETVLEVAGHDAKTATYFVASGWGEKSQWLRNIQKTPEVEIRIGRRRFAARAERLGNEQG